MMKYLFLIPLCWAISAQAQQNLRVLFLGNSYTASNNLPAIVSQMSQASGDNVQTEENLPGGYTLEAHASNATTLQKIAQGNWDYVVIQGQSQRPAFPEAQVQSGVYPYAKILDSLVRAGNPCGRSMFFMTWGRKNGDASNCQFFTPLCTYAGMDSMLALRYRKMADDNQALLSPVGALWKAIRSDKPALELYEPDESHPNASGSFAAACAFYTMILGKNPDSVNYNYSLADSTAQYIRHMAKLVVFDSLEKWNYRARLPQAAGSFIQNVRNVQFMDSSKNTASVTWFFGDGISTTENNPSHSFDPAGPNQSRVLLVAEWCGFSDTTYFDLSFDSTAVPGGIKGTIGQELQAFPNPVKSGEVLYTQSPQSARLYNSEGQPVTAVFKHRSPKLQLPGGLYFLRDEKTGRTQKVMVIP
jgi:hypothetical protein